MKNFMGIKYYTTSAILSIWQGYNEKRGGSTTLIRRLMAMDGYILTFGDWWVITEGSKQIYHPDTSLNHWTKDPYQFLLFPFFFPLTHYILGQCHCIYRAMLFALVHVGEQT